LDHARILKIGDQRLAWEIGRMSPEIQKIAPQRFRIVSLTRGNVAPIFASRTSPAETGLVGWGARTRTWEWRNQNPSGSRDLSTRIPKNRENSTSICSRGWRQFRNAGVHVAIALKTLAVNPRPHAILHQDSSRRSLSRRLSAKKAADSSRGL
jgi:hypothetical protein